MATKNAALAKDASIHLDWADVIGANLYDCQVSLYPDFRVAMNEDAALALSAYAFSDAGTDDAKRYWRWRYSTNGGTTWSAWSTVGSYWLSVDAAAEVVLPTTATWAMFDPENTADVYYFELAPRAKITPSNINRVKDRNRQGTLLSEYLTTKDLITLEFPEEGFMHHEQSRELFRFHNDIKTFFLVGSVDDGLNAVVKVWKVQVTDDPDLAPLAPGREDLIQGTIELEEV
jgi:hypothetical protein